MSNPNKSFNNKLLNWYQEHQRDLPWRTNRNPYFTWLSEIIMQQTRVAQGLSYYVKFTQLFPTVFDLAIASETEVLKAWEGLGYYSRARNLHFTAKHIANTLNGKFPTSYSELIKLKGVGSYTAAAIASMCHNESVAVVDGNVFRVLARIFGIKEDIAKAPAKNLFKEKAEQLIGKEPGKFNEALMEFGALHCTPKQPSCETCPFQKDCYAFQKSEIDLLPVKLKKQKVTNTYYHFAVCLSGNNTYVTQLNQLTIWKGLYNFPLLSTEQKLAKAELAQLLKDNLGVSNTVTSKHTFTHLLSHKKITATFYILEQAPAKKEGIEKYALNQENPLPLSRLALKMVEELTNLQPNR